MKITLLVVGKLKEPGLRSLCDDYKKRIGRHTEVNELELKDDKALAKALPKDAVLICLEVLGSPLTSTQFSEKVLHWGSSGNGHMAFVIGGAEGIPKAVSAQARFQLSLSTLTLPHRIARLVLFEQLYRALSIWRGEPYARED